MTMDQFGGPTRQQPNEIVNEIRQAVSRWRHQDYPHITSVTRDLLQHWQGQDRERRLFFCRIETAETAIYLTETAERMGDTKALNVIRDENATHTYEGRAANYVPDFLIRPRDPASTGPDDLLTLVLEVSGEAKKEKQAKVAAAEHLWTVAVNNWGGLGRWAFLEVTDPWDAGNLIRARVLDGATTLG